MSKEFRCFIASSPPKQSFYSSAENRSDLYITFPALPIEISRSFGLKFRDAMLTPSGLSCDHLELKIMTKDYGNGVEIWRKVLSKRLKNQIFLLEKIEENVSKKTNSQKIDKFEEKIAENQEKTENIIVFLNGKSLKFNKIQLISLLNKELENQKGFYENFKNVMPDPKISLILIHKLRVQKPYKTFTFEKTYIKFNVISESSENSKKINIFKSYCIEGFDKNEVKEIKEFEKKWKNINEKFKISKADIKGYPEFICSNI